MYRIQFIAHRDDETYPFFWESTDPEIVKLLDDIALATEQEKENFVWNERFKTTDGLTYIVNWVFDTQAHFEDFVDAIQTINPELLDKRNAYFNTVGHSLYGKILDDDGDIIRKFAVTSNTLLDQ